MEQGSAPAAWYLDPSGRHEHRYWSGSAWTEHVADGGQPSVDPLPPTAAPPSAQWQAGAWQPQQQPPPGATVRPAPGPTGAIGQPADLGPRFVARLLDFILLGLVTGILGSVVVAGMLLGSHGSMFSTWGVGRSTSYPANAVSSVISAVIALGYFTLLESRRGQTLGKMLLKLQTRGPGGARPTVQQALRRNAFTAIPVLGVVPVLGAVSGLLSLIAVITIAVTIHRNTTTHRGWHDDFAGGTTVVRVG
jgi:uncharacterized RDD family membrane protein YckC